ncbi:Major Facilitator Superfamily [Aspergillus sclerotialis]|uniref:Major Facilitator Superfamily n=1 Tax=Aspergillus sclerotialis TaxID=2070753 RepID=A0A3A2ZBR1_9EURO|nr:Major Facilitator Superfamily [Aspergillus sclerotialis]
MLESFPREQSQDKEADHAHDQIQPGRSECSKEGGYGWVCVVATFLINAHTWGINSAYGVFLSFYLTSDIFPGTTALEYAFVGGLSISCAMLISPIATYLNQKVSTRLVLNIGTILETLSLITTSFVNSNWQLFLSQGACFGFGMGFCFIGSVGIVSQWFDKKRSLVNGIVASGSGTGGLIYSLATGKMIPTLGYPWAVRIIGILCFTVNIISGNLLRQRFKSSKEAPSFRLSLLKKPIYLLFLGWGFLSAMGYIGLLFSLSSYTVAVGHTQSEGSLASAFLNLGQAIGRSVIGLLSDRFGRIEVPFIATFLTGLFSLVIWIFAKTLGVIFFYAILTGLFAGTLWAAAAPMGTEVVGLEDLPSALGILWFVLTPPTAVAEAIAVQLRDSSTDSKPYVRVQLFIGFVYIGAAVCLIPLRIILYRKRRDPKLNEATS